jgi:hypothetical protein
MRGLPDIISKRRPPTTIASQHHTQGQICQTLEEWTLWHLDWLLKCEAEIRWEEELQMYLESITQWRNGGGKDNALIRRKNREEADQRIDAHGSIELPSQHQYRKALRTAYRYRRLDPGKDEIRLIKIRNCRSRDDPVLERLPETESVRGSATIQQAHKYTQCNLEHHKIRELVGNHTYEAVSYVWGSSDRACSVVSDECTSSLKITPNLQTVLSRLAQRSEAGDGGASYLLDGTYSVCTSCG